MAFQSSGLLGYNNVSQSQLQVALRTIPEILSSLQNATSLSPSIIKIADFGCSEGKNSIHTFKSALTEFRSISSTPISILHTDLPSNNWQAFNETINSAETSYLHLENIYFSTLGRSFFSQLVPSGSLHMAYSSFALHYLSKKVKRSHGEFGWVFENNKIQAFQDMELILSLRLNELAIGGNLLAIINAREFIDKQPTFNRYNFDSVKRLVEKGKISEEEFFNYVWHSYPYHADEMKQVLEKFQGKIEVIKCEHGKIHFPYYKDFLETKDLERFKEDMEKMMRIMMKNALFTCLERCEEEKERILQGALNEIKAMCDEGVSELHQDYVIVLIRKIAD